MRSHDGATGQIEVITGGMFSGKSEELVRRLRRALIARQRVQVFKPIVDHRHAPDKVVTRDSRELAASTVASAAELESRLDPDVQVVGVDEAQFFDQDLVAYRGESGAVHLFDRVERWIDWGPDREMRRNRHHPRIGIQTCASQVHGLAGPAPVGLFFVEAAKRFGECGAPRILGEF